MFNGCSGFGYGGAGYGGFGIGLFMTIIPLIIIGIIIYAVFKQLNQQRYSHTRDNNDALNILMERYALGEISEEEYISKKKLLRR